MGRVAYAVSERSDGRSFERQRPGQQLVENDARREQVRALIPCLAEVHLGCHVDGRANGRSRPGQTAGIESSDSEVGDLEATVRGNDRIARCVAAMDDAVCTCERAA